MKRSMPIVRKAAFWIITGVLVCAPVGVVEVYLRSVGLGNPILFYANASYRFAPQPNQKQVRIRGATVTVDSKGFRSTKDWSEAADAKILFIGASVTWGGTFIDDNDLFSEGVCQRLAKSTGKRYICANTGANQYGTDNMAERIRYKGVDDESALVVTITTSNTTNGLVDAEGRFFFMRPPPQPFPALWEATTFVTWKLYHHLRPVTYRADDDLRVAQRSLENLFGAIHETQRPGRRVLIVQSPHKYELHGQEGALTKHVQSILARTPFEVLDLHASVSEAEGDGFYYDNDHLDVRGHHFFADQIAKRLGPLMKDESANGTY
jgi:hypothetical protein